MTEDATRDAQERQRIEEAGERRRQAMREHGVASYRSLRVEENDGQDKLERRASDPFEVAASFLPEGRPVQWDVFRDRAVESGVAQDDSSARVLLRDLVRDGAVRLAGRVPNASVVRPARPQRPTFTSNDAGADERADLVQVIENQRRRLAELEAWRAWR